MKKHALTCAAIALALAIGYPAHACASLTPQGVRMLERQQARFLAEEADKRVTGTWHLLEEGATEDGDTYRSGEVEVETRRGLIRYRLTIPEIINCGFPNYYVEDGQRGVFYLRKDEDPEPDDPDDGYIDNFYFVHFVLRETAK